MSFKFFLKGKIKNKPAKMKFNNDLDREYLEKILHYDPLTGIFTRLKSQYRPEYIGKQAGYLHRGYVEIKIKGKAYSAHRLAWLLMTGIWPAYDIDHIDMNRSNNKWENLREATRSENLCNTTLQSNNTTGHKGIVYNKRIKRYMVTIGIEGQRQYLGCFKYLEDAVIVRNSKATKSHKEFYREK